MSQPSPHSTLLNAVMAKVQEHPGLRLELQRAQREFFAAQPEGRPRQPAAELRFAEWFVLERESESLGDVPLEGLAVQEETREPLRDSVLGVFLVLGPSGGEVLLKDLQDGSELEIEPPAGIELRPDDLLIGRLYAGSLDTYHCSEALAAQREAGALAAAFRKDLQAMELDRRLNQAELEHLLFRGPQAADAELPREQPLERLEAELETLLQRGGVDEEKLSATAISKALEAALRPGPVVNPLLEQLAFDSKVDLHEFRELLLRIWNQHQARQQQETDAGPGKRPAPATSTADEDHQPGLGAEVLRRLEAGLEQGGEVEEVFDEVDKMLGVEAEEEPDARALAAAGEGDLRPLLQEFLWEEDEAGQDQGLRGHLEQLLRTQLEAPVPVLDMERLQPADLLRTLLEVYLRAAPGQRAASVGDCFASIQRFFDWAERTQEYRLRAVLEEVQRAFVEPSTRLDLGGLALGAAAQDSSANPRLLRVVALGTDALQLATLDEDEVHELAAAPEVLAQIQPEDLILAALLPGAERARLGGMVVVLPALARDFLGA